MRGSIIGDIIGSTHEFATKVDSKEFELFPYGSTFTDDTVLTIAVYDSLKNNISLEQSFMKWIEKYPNRGYGSMFFNWILSKKKEPYGSTFTDDTVLTIAVYDSLKNNILLEQSFMKWIEKYPDRGYGGMFFN